MTFRLTNKRKHFVAARQHRRHPRRTVHPSTTSPLDTADTVDARARVERMASPLNNSNTTSNLNTNNNINNNNNTGVDTSPLHDAKRRARPRRARSPTRCLPPTIRLPRTRTVSPSNSNNSNSPWAWHEHLPFRHRRQCTSRHVRLRQAHGLIRRRRSTAATATPPPPPTTHSMCALSHQSPRRQRPACRGPVLCHPSNSNISRSTTARTRARVAAICCDQHCTVTTAAANGNCTRALLRGVFRTRGGGIEGLWEVKGRRARCAYSFFSLFFVLLTIS